MVELEAESQPDMIGSLRGTVLERHGEGTTLIEVGGVGYLVTVTPRTLAELEPTSPAFLYIHHHIREVLRDVSIEDGAERLLRDALQALGARRAG